MAAETAYNLSACARCADNSWYYYATEERPERVTCACRGDIKPRAECPFFKPKAWYTGIQRWIGIFAYDHPSGFRCYDISRWDFFWWYYIVGLLMLVVGIALGYYIGQREVRYNYIEDPGSEKVYYLEKEDYDQLMPIIYGRSIFMDDVANHTTIKLNPAKYSESMYQRILDRREKRKEGAK